MKDTMKNTGVKQHTTVGIHLPKVVYSDQRVTSYFPTKYSIHKTIDVTVLDLYTKWIISIPLVGFSQNELSVKINQLQITIKGNTKELNDSPLQVNLKEFSFKALLPYEVDPMVILFRYFDSMVRITIPKKNFKHKSI